MDDGPPRGLNTQMRLPFVYTDVITAYSPWCSPSTPDDYVRALVRHYPQGPDADTEPRPALAIADFGLHSVVKSACDRAGIEHIVGLRVRVVPQHTYRMWGERVGTADKWLDWVTLANMAPEEDQAPRLHDAEASFATYH